MKQTYPIVPRTMANFSLFPGLIKVSKKFVNSGAMIEVKAKVPYTIPSATNPNPLSSNIEVTNDCATLYPLKWDISRSYSLPVKTREKLKPTKPTCQISRLTVITGTADFLYPVIGAVLSCRSCNDTFCICCWCDSDGGLNIRCFKMRDKHTHERSKCIVVSANFN